jgi:hypothetical protein
VLPVLAFPEPGLDDTAAYQGYRTRFYRDSKRNTVQIYIEPRTSRVVLLWADAANESAGFTARDAAGRPARLEWGVEEAGVSDSGTTRSIEYRLTAHEPGIQLGWFLLGSMRVERDFVYARQHLKRFTALPFRVVEESLLVANVARLPADELRHHLALLNAPSVAELRSRLEPALTSSCSDTLCTVRAERPSLDAKTRLSLELRVDPRQAKILLQGGTVSLRAQPDVPIRFAVKVTTDAAALSPLSREQIFNRPFLDFLANARAAGDTAPSTHYRRMERQVRGVELLSSEEKLMAGLPSFATYFGRDMMMTALMMRPIWSADMAEHVIASVLRKLSPRGDVSHEEALGGQAIREHAVEYDSVINQYFRATRSGHLQTADRSLARAREVLRDLHKTRENYHMIDDEFQLPVLAARYLADSSVTVARRRAFLLEKPNSGVSRLSLLLREMALVASLTRSYAEDPQAGNLVSFPKRDATHWRSASWRDSDAGYAGGRFAMDVNALWAPQALEAIATILATLPRLGVAQPTVYALTSDIGDASLAKYARDSSSLRRAIDTWRKARRHFEVTLGPNEVMKRVSARLALLPQAERQYWQKAQDQRRNSLTFLALSLDSAGTPIPVVNTDPATGLFLEDLTPRVLSGAMKPETVLRDVEPFELPYPVALFVEGLGPLVANDAYASPEVWARFRKDPYHGPRVVWGREVNLLLMALANQMAGALAVPGWAKQPVLKRYVDALYNALGRTLGAARASGLEHNELWSYRIDGKNLRPVRYGTSSDIQLWNTTNLAVQFMLARLPLVSF